MEQKQEGKVYFAHTSKFAHVKLGLAPASTIAIKRVGDKFHYGVAICSTYDNFSRKYGREVAETRLEKGFGVMDVPEVIKSLPERDSTLTQLYQLTSTVLLKTRKWKKKVTKFNMSQVKPEDRVVASISA